MFSLFLLFLLVGFVIHLLVRHFFNKKNFVDEPDGVKKQHDMAVPISGGLSFGLSYSLFIFACLLLFILTLILFSMFKYQMKAMDQISLSFLSSFCYFFLWFYCRFV